MYSIGNIIFGCPINDDIAAVLKEWEESEDPRFTDGTDGPCGFTTFYHGASPRLVGFVGVKLGEFDECDDFRLSSISDLRPTPQQIAEVQGMLTALEPELLKLLDLPDVYVVFSTS